jgi:hypothetical protein
MESLSGSSRDNAYRRVAFISAARKEGYAEDEVAEKAGYRGAGHMRQELELWGFPAWFVEGDTPPKPKVEQPDLEPRQKAGAQNEGNEPKARTSGRVEKLPPARNAIPLFRGALEGLLRDNEELRYREETRQGRHYPYRLVSRKTPSDEEWANFAELFGLDSVARERLYFGGGEIKYGTNHRAPLSPLPELIGTYLLAGGEIEPLVEALHPKPSEANWSEIGRYIEGAKVPGRKLDGIKSMAVRLTILIRGDENKRGQPPRKESGHNLNLSDRIAAGLKAKVPPKQLHEELLANLGLSEEEFPWSEFCRLADLGLELPRRPKQSPEVP